MHFLKLQYILPSYPSEKDIPIYTSSVSEIMSFPILVFPSFNNLYFWIFGNLNFPTDRGQLELFLHKLVVLRETCLLKCNISQQTAYNNKLHCAES